jgi:uncharacterized protein (DUF58 family)
MNRMARTAPAIKFSTVPIYSLPYVKLLIFISTVLFLTGVLFANLTFGLSGTAIIIYLVFVKQNFYSALSRVELNIVRRPLEPIRFANKPFTISVEIKNNSELPIRVQVKDKIPDGCYVAAGTSEGSAYLQPQASYKLKYVLRAKDKGLYAFNVLETTIIDHSRLFACTRDVELLGEVRVHADLKSIRDAKRIAKYKSLELYGKPRTFMGRFREFEFETIRDYIPGDRLRDIDWKSTSRLLKLMTKVFAREISMPTTILLDCCKSMRFTRAQYHCKLDHAVFITAQLAHILQMQGNPVGLITFDEHKILHSIFPPQYGLARYYQLFDVLAKTPDRIKRGSTPMHESKFIAHGGKMRADSVTVNEGAMQFIRKIGPFITMRNRKYAKPTEATGIYEAIRLLTATAERNQALVLITDLESTIPSVYEAIK